jgi:transcriptional regulator with XRE-family HTH domain
MYDKQIFADNLAHFMKIHGETQVDVAKMIGVSKSNVSAYIRGEQIPRMDKVQILADHYGVRLSDLLETKKAPAEAEANDDVIIRFFRSLPLEQQRGILLALGAPPEVLAALDQQAPNE